MADEKKEPWLNWLALTTVILAVCATLATFKGGGHSTRSVLRQSQASDQWQYYQAKSIKGNLYEVQRDQLKLHAKDGEEMRALLANYETRIERYEKEKGEIKAKAETLEKERNAAQAHSQAFGLAVIFLQIAILLSSIAALLKQKPVWVVGVLVGAYGILHFLNGFYLFL